METALIVGYFILSGITIYLVGKGIIEYLKSVREKYKYRRFLEKRNKKLNNRSKVNLLNKKVDVMIDNNIDKVIDKMIDNHVD